MLTDKCQSFLPLFTLFFTMAEGGLVIKVQLKREFDSLSKDLFHLDLQIQDLKRQQNTQDQIKKLNYKSIKKNKSIKT